MIQVKIPQMPIRIGEAVCQSVMSHKLPTGMFNKIVQARCFLWLWEQKCRFEIKILSCGFLDYSFSWHWTQSVNKLQTVLFSCLKLFNILQYGRHSKI